MPPAMGTKTNSREVPVGVPVSVLKEHDRDFEKENNRPIELSKECNQKELQSSVAPGGVSVSSSGILSRDNSQDTQRSVTSYTSQDTQRSVTSSLSMSHGAGEVYSPRDSGILDDRSSSHGNSLDSSINIGPFEGIPNNSNGVTLGKSNVVSNGSNSMSNSMSNTNGLYSQNNNLSVSVSQLSHSQIGGNILSSHILRGPEEQRSGVNGERSGVSGGPLPVHLDRSSSLSASGRRQSLKTTVPGSQFYSRETSMGELQVSGVKGC